MLEQQRPTVSEQFRALPEVKCVLLCELLEEMVLINKGGLRMPNGRIVYLSQGRGIPLPQTNPSDLIDKLLALPDEWQKLLANEILLLLETFYRGGFVEAVSDAWQWCKKYGLDVPAWVRDAPEKATEQGKPTLDSKWKQFRKDYIRTAAIVESADVIAAERKQPSAPRDLRRRDKYARAKELLQGPWVGAAADTESTVSTKTDAAISEKRNELEGRLKSLHTQKRELIAEGEGINARQLDSKITPLVAELNSLTGESRKLATGNFSTKGMEKSYKKIIEGDYHLYPNTERLMNVFHFNAPTLFKLLS